MNCWFQRNYSSDTRQWEKFNEPKNFTVAAVSSSCSRTFYPRNTLLPASNLVVASLQDTSTQVMHQQLVFENKVGTQIIAPGVKKISAALLTLKNNGDPNEGGKRKKKKLTDTGL